VVTLGLVVQDDLMANLRTMVVDCGHPASLARFWAAAFDGYAVAPYDEAELAKLRAIGIDDPEDDPTVLVERVDGGGLRLLFQRVPDGKVAEPRTGRRIHLDVIPTDRSRDDEVERLKLIGATVYEDHRKPDRTGWVTMADPEGNLFCVEPSAAERDSDASG
jgi:Glyoxalase-like domain